MSLLAFGSTGISTPNLNIGASLGGSAFGAIGYGFGNGLRAELEFDYRGDSFDSINGVSQRTGAAHTTPGVNGSEQLYGPMVSILYNFNGLSSWVIPYAGVGVGYQGGHLSNFSVAGTGPAAPVFASDTTKAAFAYQGILGVDFPIQSLPGLSLTADYRIMGLAGTRTYNAALTATLPSGVRATGVGTMQWGQEFNNTFMFGIRYNFGVVPPPPPATPAPVPAAAPSRSYLVFFDWDKYNLTDRARQSWGSGGQLHQGAVHADRGERLYRYLWHAAVQPGTVDPTRQGCRGATDHGRCAGECDHHSGLRRHAPLGADWSRRA